MPKGVSWVGGWLEGRLRFSCPCLRSIVVGVGAGGPEPIPECHFFSAGPRQRRSRPFDWAQRRELRSVSLCQKRIAQGE